MSSEGRDDQNTLQIFYHGETRYQGHIEVPETNKSSSFTKSSLRMSCSIMYNTSLFTSYSMGNRSMYILQWWIKATIIQ